MCAHVAAMNSYVVHPDSTHKWQVRPGYRILVMGSGALRFDFPQDWLISADSKYVRLMDRLPPQARCILLASFRRISLRMTRVPVGLLLREVIHADAETRAVTRRGPIYRTFRPPLEAAWIQMQFKDPVYAREACTRVCIARGGCTLATIVFDFWPEDELRVYAAWSTLLESMAVGDYIEDPLTGRKREKRG
jgi:hypothetical protein